VEQTGANEAEYLRVLANVAAKKEKSTDQIMNNNQESEEQTDNAEHDPLLSKTEWFFSLLLCKLRLKKYKKN